MSITTVTEGSTRQFICRTSSSYPRAIVTWKLDGHLITGDVDPLEERAEYAGTTMQLVKTIGLDKRLQDYHRKILSCEARNPETGHLVTDSTRLNIICTLLRSLSDLHRMHLVCLLVDATSIEMHGIKKDKIIKAGDTIIAECTLTGGNPLGKITWYKGESDRSPSQMMNGCSLGEELLRSEYISETSGNYALSRVEFIALPSDNQLSLICKGQVENFPERLASFTLNVACKWLKQLGLSVNSISIVLLVLPAEMRIIDSTRLSNLSMNSDNLGEFECRTSVSNPQATLSISRQSNDGIKHSDIQYLTSSNYIDGTNSIKFLVSLCSIHTSVEKNDRSIEHALL